MHDRSKDSLIRMPEAIRRTGLSRPTIYRKMRDGSFPQAVRLSANCIGFYESDVDRWIASLEQRVAA
jgi:prophage regulatory protein